jgi:hypothetical protein
MSQQGAVPVPSGPDPVEREFADALRTAAYIFEREKDGRFQGSILACQAVVRFISLRGGGAELAGPFVRIAEAFSELERGGTPRPFSKKTLPTKERDRSPERKVIHTLAAAALEVLIRLGEELSVAAGHVARSVNDWPGMSQQDVRDVTVVAWRKQHRKLTDRHHKNFQAIVNATCADPDPRAAIEKLLKQGPPGHWQS